MKIFCWQYKVRASIANTVQKISFIVLVKWQQSIPTVSYCSCMTLKSLSSLNASSLFIVATFTLHFNHLKMMQVGQCKVISTVLS
jgi:hypothetical protein